MKTEDHKLLQEFVYMQFKKIKLNVNDLNTLVLELEEQYNASKGKTYLKVRTKRDKTLKLSFDVALDILNTKLEELSEEEIKIKLKALKKK